MGGSVAGEGFWWGALKAWDPGQAPLTGSESGTIAQSRWQRGACKWEMGVAMCYGRNILYY